MGIRQALPPAGGRKERVPQQPCRLQGFRGPPPLTLPPTDRPLGSMAYGLKFCGGRGGDLDIMTVNRGKCRLDEVHLNHGLKKLWGGDH